jgi:hypothetical protein
MNSDGRGPSRSWPIKLGNRGIRRRAGTTRTKRCFAVAMDPWTQLLRNPTFLRGRAAERRREAEKSTGTRQWFCERVAAELEQEAATIESKLSPSQA